MSDRRAYPLILTMLLAGGSTGAQDRNPKPIAEYC